MELNKENVKAFYAAMSDEEIKRINEKSIRQANADYEKFRNAFKIGKCSLCGKSLKTFSKGNTCLHWLLRPNGVKKSDIRELLKEKSFFQLVAYLRWIANQEAILMNINDLVDEKNPSKIIETTIKYKHIKWAISCSVNDYKGHVGKSADFPHYHFEMQLRNQSFIKFNDFHIPFKEEDLFKMISIRDLGAIERYSDGGYGMQAIMDLEPSILMEHLVATEDEKKGIVEINTIAYFEDGIDVSEISKMMEDAKSKKTTITKLLQEKADSCTSVLTASDSVPIMKQRSGRNKKNN